MNPRNINRHQSLAGRMNEREERADGQIGAESEKKKHARPETVSPPS